MTDLALVLIGALLVNNFVLAQFLGLCPFMGVTKGYDTALATGLATTFVLTLAAVLSYLLFHAVLVPLDLEYLRIIVFITTIAGVVQFVHYYIRATAPLLHQVLGIYIPLITSSSNTRALKSRLPWRTMPMSSNVRQVNPATSTV